MRPDGDKRGRILLRNRSWTVFLRAYDVLSFSFRVTRDDKIY
jgi:hypothetical protein